MRGTATLAIAILLAPAGAGAQSWSAPAHSRSITVRFEGGDALVSDRFRSVRNYAGEGELYFRVPLPEHAALASVLLCERGGCKRAIADRLENGLFVAVPESVAGAFTVHVRWEAPLWIEDGLARMVVATGDPARRAPIDVELEAPGLTQLRIGGVDRTRAHGLAPGTPLVVEAALPATTRVHVARSSCRGRACARVAIVAGRREPVPVRSVIALPLSPSSLEITAARIRRAAELVVRSLPYGSEVRFLTYGHGAPSLSPWVPVVRADVSAVALPIEVFPIDEPLSEAIDAASGATRSMIVVAGASDVRDATALAARARGARVRVSLVGVGDEPLSPSSIVFARSAGGIAVSLGDLLEMDIDPPAARLPSQSFEPSVAAAVARRLAVLSAPIVERDVTLRIASGIIQLGDLRAGQHIAWQGAEMPEVRISGVPRRPDRVRVSQARAVVRSIPSSPRPRAESRIIRCGGHCAVLVRGATSREVVARAFQRTVRPRARECFRRARAGRPDFDARVEVAAVFTRGEPTTVRATGGDLSLRTCVEDAVRTARLPALEETVVVSYPFATRARRLPAPAPMADDLDARLADLFGEAAVLRLAP